MDNWLKMNGQKIKIPILDAVENVLIRELESSSKLKVCIGTDSQVYGTCTDFATVIVFLRDKAGGFMFVKKEKINQPLALKERMMLEVARSIDIAYHLCDLFSLYEVAMEVHADINPDPRFKSHVALHEAMGYIKGMGFEFKAKPDAFASSSCANKHC